MLVFRETREECSGKHAKAELAQRLASSPLEDAEALLCSAEIECALADAGHYAQGLAAALTDEIADAWLAREQAPRQRALELCEALLLPSRMLRRRPEGYAFYALCPERYRDMALAEARVGQEYRVIGVRSIGTSLSAIVASALRRSGARAERITTRPKGHPFERKVEWSHEDRVFLDAAGGGAEFLVVDEGPGLSGSTFLAVGDALAAHAILPQRVAFLSSHAPDTQTLLAPNAAERFARFRRVGAAPWRPPPSTFDFSGGLWRRHVEWGGSAWPPCWSPHERAKYLSPDGYRLHKFVGFAPYDQASRARAEALSRAKWSPPTSTAECGFVAHDWATGRRANAHIDAERAPEVFAAYFAFRREALASKVASTEGLETMAKVNAFEELGAELPNEFRLDVVTPVQVDGRLMPHEWVVHPSGRWLKTDSSDHADDQFFPGPVDVAWDFAGAAVEWDWDEPTLDELCRRYALVTNDQVGPRLSPYLVAYAAFRVGFAAFAEGDGEGAERRRWRAARARYRVALTRALRRIGVACAR